MSNNYTVQMNTTEVDIDTFNDEKRDQMIQTERSSRHVERENSQQLRTN